MDHIDEILKKPAEPMILIPASIGGMKVEYHQKKFVFYFTKKGVTFWRCEKWEKNCPAKIMTKDKKTYSYVEEHNHSMEEIENEIKIKQEKKIEIKHIQIVRPPILLNKNAPRIVQDVSAALATKPMIVGNTVIRPVSKEKPNIKELMQQRLQKALSGHQN